MLFFVSLLLFIYLLILPTAIVTTSTKQQCIDDGSLVNKVDQLVDQFASMIDEKFKEFSQHINTKMNDMEARMHSHVRKELNDMEARMHSHMRKELNDMEARTENKMERLQTNILKNLHDYNSGTVNVLANISTSTNICNADLTAHFVYYKGHIFGISVAHVLCHVFIIISSRSLYYPAMD